MQTDIHSDMHNHIHTDIQMRHAQTDIQMRLAIIRHTSPRNAQSPESCADEGVVETGGHKKRGIRFADII